MIKKIWSLVLIGIFILVIVVGAGLFFLGKKDASNQRFIVVTNPAMELVMSRLVGGQISIINVVPPGISPHDFEPTPRDIAIMENAYLVVVSGQNIEAWYENLRPNLEKNNVPTLEISQHLPLGEDVHFWLDPVLMAETVSLVSNQLQGLNLSNNDEIEKNAQKLINELNILNEKYTQILAPENCQNQNRFIITPHLAFRHFANRYHFQDLPISISHEVEPTPTDLANLLSLIKTNNLPAIFDDPQDPSPLAQSLANQANVKILPLSALEVLPSEPAPAYENYLTILEENLKTIQTYLGCNNV